MTEQTITVKTSDGKDVELKVDSTTKTIALDFEFKHYVIQITKHNGLKMSGK